MMHEPFPVRPVKKPHGCWWLSGCLITSVSTLMIVFFVYMMVYSEQKMDENRAEYAAYSKEYDEEMAAFEADSVAYRELYHRDRPEWNPRGAIGFNIAGGFFFFFALFMLIPLIIGVLLLVYYRHRYRKWRIDDGQKT